MKLIYQGTQVVATASDGYTGPEKFIKAPENFNVRRAREYQVVNGEVIAPATPDIQVQGREAMQAVLDAKAAERGYGSKDQSPSFSIATYLNSKNLRFRKEAEIFEEYRSDLWTAGYQLIGEIQLGFRPMPSSIIEVLALLPTLNWADHEHLIPPLPVVTLPPPAPAPAPAPEALPPAPAPEPEGVPEPEPEPEPPAEEPPVEGDSE